MKILRIGMAAWLKIDEPSLKIANSLAMKAIYLNCFRLGDYYTWLEMGRGIEV